MSQAEGPAALPRRIRRHYLHNFQDPRRERLFLSSVGFDVGALGARAITHLIRRGIGPFRNLTVRGRHFHHLVFGITGLLGSGLAWLVIADDAAQMQTRHRATAFAFGLGAALTLDEFALWLDLEDVYWTRQGKMSVEALMIFGSLLSLGVWGGPFLKSTAQEVVPGLTAPRLRRR